MAITQGVAPLPDGTQAIEVELGDGRRRRFLNRCPHLGVPLDWGDGRCLTDDGRLLICAMHAALFDPDSGDCLSGPCAGKALQRLPDVAPEPAAPQPPP